MREILYRGIAKSHGTFEFGDLITSMGKIYIGNTVGNHPDNWCEVIPETVGQFTGLTLENGVKIFEGDILESDYWACTCLVIWKDGGFTLQEGETSTLIGCQLIDDYGHELDDVQVIGNIHDNPELL